MANNRGRLTFGGFWEKAGGFLLPRDAAGDGYGVLLRERRAEIAFCTLFVFASGWGQTFLLSLFQPHWRAAFGLSAAQMGGLYGGATLLSGLLLPMAGRWLDRVSARSAAIVALVGLAAAAALAAGTTGVWMLALALFALRFFGQGLTAMLGVTCAARWFTVNRAKAVSLAGLGFPLGEAVLPMTIVLVLAAIGWRATWGVLAAAALLVLLPVALRLLRHRPARTPRAGPEPEIPDLDNARARHDLLRDWRFYAMLAIAVPVPFMGTGIIFFQATLAEARGWGPAVFPTGFMVFAIVRASFSLVAGSWADRLGSLRLLPMPTSLFAIGLLCLIPSPVGFAYVFFAILGIGFGAASGIMTTAWTDLFGAHRIGLVKGLSGSVGVFSTAVAPVAFGIAFQSGISIDILLAFCAALILAVCWPLSLLLKSHSA